MSTESDVTAIKALIGRQFASMSWNTGAQPDWEQFNADYFPGAQLFPSARPAVCQTVPAFAERIKTMVGSALVSFEERVLGTTVHVFNNVAVAVVACENIENNSHVEIVVEMMLLVKDQGLWRIVAQGWDKLADQDAIPSGLIADRWPDRG